MIQKKNRYILLPSYWLSDCSFVLELNITPKYGYDRQYFLWCRSRDYVLFSDLWLNVIGMGLLILPILWMVQMDNWPGLLTQAKPFRKDSGYGLRILVCYHTYCHLFTSLRMKAGLHDLGIRRWSRGFSRIPVGYGRYYHNVHLFFIKGVSSGELDNTADYKEIRQRCKTNQSVCG
ncbi:hypothetical protein CS542_05205 [Pedobacter sp. IW39]|nr:hypothetical protein CS542_05205 [Pedobacter sp. IW39]